MTITQLKYCIALAEHRNFTVAAEKCFVTQPTLSMQVQKLEEELDILIFDRSQKPIALTAVGEKIINQAVQIVAESERMQDIVDQEKGYVGGVFRLGIIPTVMPTLLPMFLRNTTNKYPDLQLQIEELNTDQLLDKIREGELDAAIAATPLEEDKILESVLYYEPFMAYVPPTTTLHQKNELTAEDLSEKNILLLEDGHCFRNNVLNLCPSKTEQENKNFAIKSGSFETLVHLANEGLGITLLPYLHSKTMTDKDQKNLRNFLAPAPARAISLVYHEKKLKLHIIDALHQVISGIVRAAIAFEDVKIISPKNTTTY